MSNPDIQYFGQDGTWHKPAGAARVDVVLQGGGSGSTTAGIGRHINPVGVPGAILVNTFAAAELPDVVTVEIGKGGRPGGRDGYALIITHLAETSG